eukprot:2711638-Rhodomonas_salina.1
MQAHYDRVQHDYDKARDHYQLAVRCDNPLPDAYFRCPSPTPPPPPAPNFLPPPRLIFGDVGCGQAGVRAAVPPTRLRGGGGRVPGAVSPTRMSYVNNSWTCCTDLWAVVLYCRQPLHLEVPAPAIYIDITLRICPLVLHIRQHSPSDFGCCTTVCFARISVRCPVLAHAMLLHTPSAMSGTEARYAAKAMANYGLLLCNPLKRYHSSR